MKYSYILILAALIGFASCKSNKEKSQEKIKTLQDDYTKGPTLDKAKLLDSALKSYTADYPRDEKTPGYLFDDAKLHVGILNNPLQAVSIYKQIYTDYPDNKELAPEALFHYGYFQEQLGNQGEARKAYEALLAKYPDSEWADDAKGSLDMLGKDLNEVIKGFEQKDSAKVNQ
jgi:outer membrane protein assembly factor BamD (BamD/ComL family)